jgi:hypothetical protein
MNESNVIVVRSRLEAELKNIMRLYDSLERRNLLKPSNERSRKLSDDFTLRAVGSIFHDFYTSIENMFKIVGRYIDRSLPEGPDWHLELLEQMATPITKIRNAVISSYTRDLLNEFRAFRHVFRNVYGFNLIQERLERLLDIFPIAIDQLKNDVYAFIEDLDEICGE